MRLRWCIPSRRGSRSRLRLYAENTETSTDGQPEAAHLCVAIPAAGCPDHVSRAATRRSRCGLLFKAGSLGFNGLNVVPIFWSGRVDADTHVEVTESIDHTGCGS